MYFHGLGVFWNMSGTVCSGQRLQRNEHPGLLEVSQGLRVLVTCKFKRGCLLKVSHVPLVGAVCGSLGSGSAPANPYGDFVQIIQIPTVRLPLFLLAVGVWARFFQGLGYLFRELKMRAHTDLPKKQKKFVRSKESPNADMEEYTSREPAGPVSGRTQLPLWGSRDKFGYEGV